LSYIGRHNCDFQEEFVILTISFVAGGDISIFFIFKAFFTVFDLFGGTFCRLFAGISWH